MPSQPPDSAPAVRAPCPACGLHELLPATLVQSEGRWRHGEDATEGLEIDTCPVCFGAFFDRGELNRISETAQVEDLVEAHGDVDPRRACPRGHGPMRTGRLPESLLSTPVERCERCGGLWLDGHERRKLAKQSTRSGQRTTAERWQRRGVIWAAQLLTQMPVEVENPAAGRPWVVYTMIAGMFAVYGAQLLGFVDMYAWAVVPGRFWREGDLWTLLSAQALHANWVHLLTNAYFLYIFGDNVEELFGRLRFTATVLLCGLAGALAHATFTTATAQPMVGLSGAISGVLGAYVVCFPRARLLQTLFYIQVELPGWAYVLVWLGFHLFMGIWTTDRATAWFAHLGGFALGVAVAPAVLRWRRRQLQRRFELAVNCG